MSKINILHTIAKKFKEDNITWGIGGSLLLYYHGITAQYNDIDILVKEEDAEKANVILSKIATKEEVISKQPFCTKYFYRFKGDCISIDVMGAFGINHPQGTYWLHFNEDSIVNYMYGEFPLSAIEDWYVLYHLIPGKEDKVAMIGNFWKTKQIQSPLILQKAMEKSLPAKIKLKIKQLLISQE